MATIELVAKSFARPDDLESHIRAVHKKEKRFGCPVQGCTSRFARKGDLNRHIRRVHKLDPAYGYSLNLMSLVAK